MGQGFSVCPPVSIRSGRRTAAPAGECPRSRPAHGNDIARPVGRSRFDRQMHTSHTAHCTSNTAHSDGDPQVGRAKGGSWSPQQMSGCFSGPPARRPAPRRQRAASLAVRRHRYDVITCHPKGQSLSAGHIGALHCPLERQHPIKVGVRGGGEGGQQLHWPCDRRLWLWPAGLAVRRDRAVGLPPHGGVRVQGFGRELRAQLVVRPEWRVMASVFGQLWRAGRGAQRADLTERDP